MTNPDNAIGTNAAYGGRTSVNAANDNLSLYANAGILSGFALSPDTGMTLSLGGVSGTRDVAIAEDSAGNRTTVDNISGAPISVTIPAAPASQSRIDAIVAYVANPPEGDSTEVDNPGACGLIVVSGTASSSPTAPNDSAIRTAITADGASGSTAYYVVIGNVTVAAGTTDITSNMITAGNKVTIDGSEVNYDYTKMKKWVQDPSSKGSTNLWPGFTGQINITDTGFLYIKVSVYRLAGNDCELHCLQNGVPILGVINSTGNSGIAVTASLEEIIPVAAGDVITFTKTSDASLSSTWKQAYFMDGRWVS